MKKLTFLLLALLFTCSTVFASGTNIGSLPQVTYDKAPKDKEAYPDRTDYEKKNNLYTASTREEIKKIIKLELEAHRKNFIICSGKDLTSGFDVLYDDNETDETELVTDLVNDVLNENSYLKRLVSWRASCSMGEFDFSCAYNETFEQTSYVKAKAKQILSLIIKPSMSDIDKEKTINNWIISNIQYDKTLIKDTAYEALNSPYKTTCYGFSLLTYEMLSQVGIENKIIYGVANGGAHAWNKVKIKNEWLNLDVTWNLGKGKTLKYFNLTDKQLSKDHSWKADQ